MSENKVAETQLSTTQIEEEILTFLSSPTPEVICISGKWGVGKTFAWRRYLAHAVEKESLALKSYSYVSLFGINSLSDMKYAIFENKVPGERADKNVTLTTFIDTLKGLAPLEDLASHGRRFAWFANLFPYTRTIFQGAAPALFLTVRDQIVCVDDLERKGRGLDLADILGLVSFLKEQRNCKVALLLNEEALEGTAQTDFRIYLEKVVDKRFVFAPSPKEAVKIAVNNTTPFSEEFSTACVDLGIKNVRVIRKIEASINDLYVLLKSFNAIVVSQAVRSCTLFGWCIYEPKVAPSLDYIRSRQSFGLALKRNQGEISDEERSAEDTLSQYKFSHLDDFDKVLLSGLLNGYFSKTDVIDAASKEDEKVKKGISRKAIEEAWYKFHYSFVACEDEVFDGLKAAYISNLMHVSPSDLDSVICILREFDRAKDADFLLEAFVQVHKGSPNSFFAVDGQFSMGIKDTRVRSVFSEIYLSARTLPDPISILKRIYETRGWHPDDLQFLASLAPQDIVNLLKSRSGNELYEILQPLIEFRKFVVPPPEMQQISAHTDEALKILAQECRLNATRVKRFGVSIPSSTPSDI